MFVQHTLRLLAQNGHRKLNKNPSRPDRLHIYYQQYFITPYIHQYQATDSLIPSMSMAVIKHLYVLHTL